MKSVMHAWQTLNARMRLIISILIGIAGIGLLILVHEFGHFLACKAFGVGTPVFSIGFGPQLLATKIGDTVFQLAAFPIGGYVEIAPDDFARQPYLQKLIILLAGIAANIVFAYIVFIYLSIKSKTTTTTIETITPGSPALQVGMMPGDRIIMINDLPVAENPALLIRTILQSPGKMVSLSYERDGVAYDTQVPILDHHDVYGSGTGSLLITLQEKDTPYRSWFSALTDGIQGVNQTVYQMGAFLTTLFRKEQRNQLIGPIGIIDITRRSFAMGSRYFLFFLGMLSLNIAFFNLLPIPFFDGGQVAFYTLEQFTGPLQSEAIFNVLSQLFLYIILIALVIITVKDIFRIRTKR